MFVDSHDLFMCPTECSGDGWELHGEKCFKFDYVSSGQITWEDVYNWEKAEEFCSTEGGKLATYQTAEDVELLIDVM